MFSFGWISGKGEITLSLFTIRFREVGFLFVFAASVVEPEAKWSLGARLFDIGPWKLAVSLPIFSVWFPRSVLGNMELALPLLRMEGRGILQLMQTVPAPHASWSLWHSCCCIWKRVEPPTAEGGRWESKTSRLEPGVKGTFPAPRRKGWFWTPPLWHVK